MIDEVEMGKFDWVVLCVLGIDEPKTEPYILVPHLMRAVQAEKLEKPYLFVHYVKKGKQTRIPYEEREIPRIPGLRMLPDLYPKKIAFCQAVWLYKGGMLWRANFEHPEEGDRNLLALSIHDCRPVRRAPITAR